MHSLLRLPSHPSYSPQNGSEVEKGLDFPSFTAAQNGLNWVSWEPEYTLNFWQRAAAAAAAAVAAAVAAAAAVTIRHLLDLQTRS